MGSSAECAKAKKIASESCGQVNVAPAESVKENPPNHWKPQLGGLSAEGKPCKCEREAAEIIVMAERGWVMSKPLEAERISQVEMRMCRKAIQLNRCELESQAIHAAVHLLSQQEK